MGLIVDSSEVITAERLGQTAYEMMQGIVAHVGDQALAMSVVTVLELAHGLARADTESRRAKRQRFLDDLLAEMPVQAVTVPIALRAGRLDGYLRALGKGIPLADLLIGATALELGYSVLTSNKRHFDQIPGLTVVD
jgi:predicted nucleic acid-binding protein